MDKIHKELIKEIKANPMMLVASLASAIVGSAPLIIAILLLTDKELLLKILQLMLR